MSQQVKLLVYSQERLDLPDFNDFQNFIEEDFQLLQKGLVTGSNTYIIKGFAVSHVAPPSLQISINLAGAVVINGAYDGTLYYGPSTAGVVSDLAVDGATTYWWFEVSTLDTANEIRTFWDPSLENGAGAEFNQAVNTQQELVLTLEKSTVGFPPPANNVIHLCKTIAAGGTITSFVDCRKMLFRLGTGGNTPDLDNVFPWTAGRTEPGTTGTASVFTGGDKNLTCIKDMFDAITSVIKEMKFGTGTGVGATWFAPTPNTLSNMNVVMVDGEVWAWNSGTGRLTMSADASFIIPGTAFTNTIDYTDPMGTTDPWILIPSDGQVAWVQIDRTSNAVLTVSVEASSTYVPAVDKIIIVRRIGGVVYIG